MKTYTIESNRLQVREEIDGGVSAWDLDAVTALKMLDMFEDMPEEIRTQLEQITVADAVESQ